MDLLQNFVSAVPDFDLESENIGGIFTNLTVLSMLLNTIIPDRPFPITKEVVLPEYDFIIVGAGPAGSVMAHRLSENPCISVLLLEAGDSTPFLSDVPAFARAFFGSSIDWLYMTEPQKYAAEGLHENRVPWNSGKGLGGGSIINAMCYVRGNMRDFDQWAAEGATGWSYKDVLPSFLKLEDNKNIAELDPGYHNKSGPQSAERVNYEPEIKYPVIEALEELGYKNIDINGRNQTGIYDMQGFLRNGQRCSAAKSYLVPAETRPNLDIVKGAFVTKILIEDGRAVGVQYDRRNQTSTVRARREVILSCGSVRTVQLLMLSGIGPREELSKFNINVTADLPVGKNLQDHCASTLMYTVDARIINVIPKLANPVNIFDYIVNRHGPMAAPTQITVMAFTSGSNGSAVTEDFPRQELYFAEYNTIDAKVNSNLKPGIYEKYYERYLLKPLYACISSLLRPRSRGQITLNSTNPYDQPLINPNYYEDPRDLEDVVEGLKICEEVARSPSMKKVKAKSVDIPFPGCEEFFQIDEDKYLTCYARHVINSFWHPTGVARMGDPSDPDSVVDTRLRVIGVQGLRVINAAVMPNVPSGNTNLPTLMLAERAYDLMKEEVKCPETKITVGPVTVEPGTVGPVPVEPGIIGDKL